MRSAWRIKGVYKSFYASHGSKPDRSVAEFGKGENFHLVIIGDSTFDVHALSKVPYGPAQVFIDAISKTRKVKVHFFASAGAKTADVIGIQLPKLAKIPRVDLILVYMGANDVVTGRWPGKVSSAYKQLLEFTEAQGIKVVASELANYWHFSLFPILFRGWLYIAINYANTGIRAQSNKSKHMVAARIKQMHKSIHKSRRIQPYLYDGFHPDDLASEKWGEAMLAKALSDPKTKRFFVDIMS